MPPHVYFTYLHLIHIVSDLNPKLDASMDFYYKRSPGWIPSSGKKCKEKVTWQQTVKRYDPGQDGYRGSWEFFVSQQAFQQSIVGSLYELNLLD